MGLKTSFVTELDKAYTTDLEGLGTLRWESPNKCYKWIIYEAGTAAVAGVAGEVAYYFEDSGHQDNKVTSDVSDCTGEIGAGVLQAALADGEYGWIQVKGNALLTIALTAGADGDSLTGTGAGDGTLDLAVAGETDAIVAIAEDASAKFIICDFPF